MSSLARLLFLSVLVLGSIAHAQPPPTPSEVVDAGLEELKEEEAAPSSPRVSVSTFLSLTNEGRFEEAAGYLDLPKQAEDGPERARKLRAVLDRMLWLDLGKISGVAGGNTEDDLPTGTDELGKIARDDGTEDPVRIIQRTRGGVPRWLFTRETVERVDRWYLQLDDRWLIEHLPPSLLRSGPQALMWWQWMALPLLFFAAWIVGKVLGRMTEKLFSSLVSKTSTDWDDRLITNLRRPITLAWALLSLGIAFPFLALNPASRSFLDRGMRVGFFIAFFWALLRAVDTAGQFVVYSPWSKHHPASRSLIPLGARVGKVAVFLVAVVAVVSELGYPVASLVAGLGIGGLAVALAAQKTVENLFGAFSLGVDQPFREGDFVKVEDAFSGTVETVGLRSTRFRTADRTIITVPNGKLAEMRLESLAERDRMRMGFDMALSYSTTTEQLRQVLTDIEALIRNHPKVWPDGITVRLKELGAVALMVEINAWFKTPEWSEFQLIRQNLLLAFMAAVEKAGTSFAYPAPAVQLVAGTPVQQAPKAT